MENNDLINTHLLKGQSLDKRNKTEIPSGQQSALYVFKQFWSGLIIKV